MSVQAITWALEQTVGSPTGKVILLCLANYADKHGACFPGQKAIAAECEVSARSVVEWLAKLEEMGLLVRSRRFRQNGSRTSDSIILRLPWVEDTTSTGQSAEFAHSAVPSAAGAHGEGSPSANERVDQVQHVHPHNRQKNQEAATQPRENFVDELFEAAGIKGNPHPSLAFPGPILAMIAAGYDQDTEILPAVRSRPNPSVRSWQYYVPVIEQFAAKVRGFKANAPPKPEVVEGVVTLDRYRDEALFAECERLMGKPVPTSMQRYSFPADIIQKAQQERAA